MFCFLLRGACVISTLRGFHPLRWITSFEMTHKSKEPRPFRMAALFGRNSARAVKVSANHAYVKHHSITPLLGSALISTSCAINRHCS